MHFQSVIIENFKAIEAMQIDFDPGINLLIGDNGVGKTCVLEALTVALGGFLSGISGVATRGIWESDVRIVQSLLADASIGVQYMTPVSISCKTCVGIESFEWARTRGNVTAAFRTKTTNKAITRYAQEIVNDLTRDLPLLSYMGTTRVSQPKREDYGAVLKKTLTDRRCGYIGCLDSALDIKAIKAWCLKMEMVSYNKNKPIKEYETFKRVVSSVMKHMTALENNPVITYSRVFEDIVYSEGSTILPISYLSAGYQSLLWITMDIAYRMAILNPGLDDFKTVTGIVLIDELDMHLHPKWQWNVLEVLAQTFPNIQFIIATHSPILISSCKNGKLIMLDEFQKVCYLENAYAYSVEDVIELRQGSSGIPKAIKEMRHQFDIYMDTEQYDHARKLLSEMKASYGEGNTEVKIAMLELELEESSDLDRG